MTGKKGMQSCILALHRDKKDARVTQSCLGIKDEVYGFS
jgi:hypothetical protein